LHGLYVVEDWLTSAGTSTSLKANCSKTARVASISAEMLVALPSLAPMFIAWPATCAQASSTAGIQVASGDDSTGSGAVVDGGCVVVATGSGRW
jgi:hypothetical protein